MNRNPEYITADNGINENPEQSSTGNVTGIYDLSGGTNEQVAAYYIGDYNGRPLVDETDRRYVTEYTGTSEKSAYKPGDATYETMDWHDDSSTFIGAYGDNLYLPRGGYRDNGTNDAGIFNYYAAYGQQANYTSFRMCLVVK